MRQQTTDLDDGSVCKSSTESVPQLPPLGRNGGKQSKILAHDGVPKNGLLLCLQHTCRIGDRHGGRRLRTADSVAPAAGAGALVLKLGACGQTPHVSHATGIRRAYGGHNVRMHAARTALARGARDGHTRRIRQKRGACNCNGSSNVCNVSSNVPSRPFFGTACSLFTPPCSRRGDQGRQGQRSEALCTSVRNADEAYRCKWCNAPYESLNSIRTCIRRHAREPCTRAPRRAFPAQAALPPSYYCVEESY